MNYQSHHLDPKSADAAERLNNLSDERLLEHCEDELYEIELCWMENNIQNILDTLKERQSLGAKYYPGTANSPWGDAGEELHVEMTNWACAQLRMKYAARVGAGDVPDWLTP